MSVTTSQTAMRDVTGNSRLTAWAGWALAAGFGAELLTLFNVGWYLTLHIWLGLALIAPLLVKTASTGYRFARYYTGDADYRRSGPPSPLMRMLSPLLLACTGLVLLTGLALVLTWRWHVEVEAVHLWSTWVWAGLAVAHLLYYLFPALRLALADVRARTLGRAGVVLAAGLIGLAAGGVLAPVLSR